MELLIEETCHKLCSGPPNIDVESSVFSLDYFFTFGESWLRTSFEVRVSATLCNGSGPIQTSCQSLIGTL